MHSLICFTVIAIVLYLLTVANESVLSETMYTNHIKLQFLTNCLVSLSVPCNLLAFTAAIIYALTAFANMPFANDVRFSFSFYECNCFHSIFMLCIGLCFTCAVSTFYRKFFVLPPTGKKCLFGSLINNPRKLVEILNTIRFLVFFSHFFIQVDVF